MLKNCFLGLTLLCLVGVLTASVVAQDNGGNQPQSGGPGGPPERGFGRHHMDPAQRTEMLTKQLKLTSDQQSKVLDILKSEQSQMEKLRSDSSLPQDDRRSKMMDIRKSSDTQVRALLDADQQKKWDKMQSERGHWGGPPHDGPGSGPPPEPPDQR
jgi:Spy/CpxP family protein refolding chaperone